MKRILFILSVLIVHLTTGCKDNYDDSALWKDIDVMYKDLNELKTQISSMQDQINALSSILNGSIVTGLSQNSDGDYIVRYKDSDNIERSFTIAALSQANTEPIIGIKAIDNVYYWTTTVDGVTNWLCDVDGKKIPTSGRTPEIDIDSNGYWTLFGIQIKDCEGNPVKAEGKTASVITSVENNDDGTVSFILGDGSTLNVKLVNGFTVLFDVESTTEVSSETKEIVVNYTLVGNDESTLISLQRIDGLKAELNEKTSTIKITFEEGFERGIVIVMLYDGAENIVLKPLNFVNGNMTPTGITDAQDLISFAQAVNAGGNLSKYTIEGEICLMNDIDMTGIDWSSYVIGGIVTPSTTSANTSVSYTMTENVFNKVFNGKGYALKNINWIFNSEDGNISHALFSALGADAEVKDLTIEGEIELTGKAPQGTLIGSFAGYVEGKIINCNNKASISFTGSDASNISICMGGIAGYNNNGEILKCVNDGVLTCGTIANTGNGTNSGFHQGGIIGFLKDGKLSECANNADISAPSGRGGGIIGIASAGEIVSCINNGLIQDDVNGVFGGANPSYKRMGGLVGGTTANVNITSCINNGNVFSQLGCRTGGFVGHNEATINKCTNNGIILSDHTKDGSNYHGSGWAAGYNKTATSISECVIGGKVGDYTMYKNNPFQAPESTFSAAVVHGNFDSSLNGLNDLYDEFYDWMVLTETEVAQGVKYYHYSMSNFKQNIYVLEVDLNNEKVVLETVMANEICPNPNANNNSNNGNNLRETLSETCLRRRNEGRNIIGGINTGFFDSNDGFPRGVHIEYGEPVFVNNKHVRDKLTMHRPGFTLFTDRTISFDNRTFTGFIKVGGNEYEYYSINDTIVRLSGDCDLDANLYTNRYVKNPHPGIENKVGTKALFIVGKCNNKMTVNDGYFDGIVTNIIDGRSGAAIDVPFVADANDWVLQVTGDKAAALASALQVGSTVQLCANLPIGSVSKPMIMHNASMYRFLNNGVWGPVGGDEPMPATTIGANETGKVIKLVCIDGRTATDTGVTYWQLFKIMKKLGMHNAVRLDGGGSTTMWKYEAGTGAIANNPCDSKGERSCMNYMHIRILE